MNSVYLLLGSNLDDRMGSLKHAKENISGRIGRITGESSVYESESWGFHSENLFLNQVVKVDTEFDAVELLGEILSIEKEQGRFRARGPGYSSRTIDIDILFFNDEIIATESLTIPHPKIPERMFTLLPLSEIDRTLIHPALHKSVGEMIIECPDRLNVYPFLEKN